MLKIKIYSAVYFKFNYFKFLHKTVFEFIYFQRSIGQGVIKIKGNHVY